MDPGFRGDEEMELLKKYKIGVLAGGSSSEREISLKSGKAVFRAFKGRDLNVVFLDVEEKNFESLIKRSGIDLAFIALHGNFGEDGTVQKWLTSKKIPHTGSGPKASRLAFDKAESKKMFKNAGIIIPEYEEIKTENDAASLRIMPPYVVKPRKEGSSIGLSVALSREKLKGAVNKALKFGPGVIVERFIPGREITVGILDEKALPVVEIVPEDNIYDFHSKYSSDRTEYIVPARLGGGLYNKAQEEGLKAHNILGCEGFSRVDMIVSDDNNIFVLEVNTIPGLTERSLLPMAAKEDGMDFSELCVKMLQIALGNK